jgi:hypothetical protein
VSRSYAAACCAADYSLDPAAACAELHRQLMKMLFTWLMVICGLAGLHGRVLAADPCEVLAAMHERQHPHHHHEPGQPCDPSHDTHCPLDHHHGNCSHAMPMAAEIQHAAGIGGFGFSLSLIRADAQLPPDAPFADLDKPPRI